MSLTPEDYPVHIRTPVAWGQLDAFGHVNNTVFFRFFEDARIACFDRIGFGSHMEKTGVGPILAHTQCAFRKPLGFPDTITACTRITDIGTDRFTMEYAVFSDAVGLAAHGDGKIVVFDYRNGVKVALPYAIRLAIEAL
jgi:acyl-CoA thioester hydrolase